MAFADDQPLLILGVSAALAYFLWNIIYNLIFHPLAKIPGPWLPALTPWYEVYFDCFSKGGGQYPFQIQKLHEKYGPIIRPVPDQVHISDPGFLDVVYASRNRNQGVNKGLKVDRSVAGAEDSKLHRIRREAMNPFFSVKAILKMQSLLVEKSEKVVSVLNDASRDGAVLNISDVYFGYANDVVRAYSFGSDSDLLGNLQESKTQRNNLARLLTSVHIQRHFPSFFWFMAEVMPKVIGSAALPPGVMDLVRFKQRTGKDIEAVLADTNDAKKGQHSVFYELRDSSVLPPEEKTADRLQDEATLLVMAGTESTAKTLGIATFYLIKHTKVMEKLRTEIRDAKQQCGGDVPLSTLLTLSYMAAVITEANRLSYGVTNRMIRYSPDETLTYTASYGPHKGTTYVLPPKTMMSTLTYCVHTNEDLFPDPLHFDPERWLAKPMLAGYSEAEVNQRKRCMLALGKGHRKCIGINLANAAVSLVLAALTNYELQLVDTEEDDIKFQYDFQISHPRLDSKGIRMKASALNRA